MHPEAPNWLPVTLDLGFAAGKELVLELVTEPIGEDSDQSVGAPSSAYAAWLNPVVFTRVEEERPNIVLVVVDALRPDHLGCYGYDQETSPFLDRLAEEGVVFETAHPTATYTFASIPSLLTSSYRFRAGADIARTEHAGPFASVAGTATALTPLELSPSLQGLLRRRGYTTLANVAGGFLNPLLGMDSGFDWFWYDREGATLAEQLAALRARLNSHQVLPFFLFLHTNVVHNYFYGSGLYLEGLDRHSVGTAPTPERVREIVLGRDATGISRAELQYIIDLYDNGIRHADREIEGFLEWLRTQPGGDNTIVIVTSDHGEMLGERGLFGHGAPYWPVGAVPMIVWTPDGRWRGRRPDTPVSLVDVAPTLLDLAGVSAPEEFVGRSLRGALEGRPEAGQYPVFIEGRSNVFLIRDGRWSYVTWPEQSREELYDMAVDPAQTRNLARMHPSTVRRMRRLLGEAAMKAHRGARVVVMGSRSRELTLMLECEGGFSFLCGPTLRGPWQTTNGGVEAPAEGSGRKAGRWSVSLPPGNDLHVILCEPDSPEDAIVVEATVDGKQVEADRFHLGRGQIHAEELPVRIAPGGRLLMPPESLPEEDLSSWGIWVWVPRDYGHQPSAISPGDKLWPGMQRQLRALGYMK